MRGTRSGRCQSHSVAFLPFLPSHHRFPSPPGHESAVRERQAVRPLCAGSSRRSGPRGADASSPALRPLLYSRSSHEPRSYISQKSCHQCPVSPRPSLPPFPRPAGRHPSDCAPSPHPRQSIPCCSPGADPKVVYERSAQLPSPPPPTRAPTVPNSATARSPPRPSTSRRATLARRKPPDPQRRRPPPALRTASGGTRSRPSTPRTRKTSRTATRTSTPKNPSRSATRTTTTTSSPPLHPPRRPAAAFPSLAHPRPPGARRSPPTRRATTPRWTSWTSSTTRTTTTAAAVGRETPRGRSRATTRAAQRRSRAGATSCDTPGFTPTSGTFVSLPPVLFWTSRNRTEDRGHRLIFNFLVSLPTSRVRHRPFADRSSARTRPAANPSSSAARSRSTFEYSQSGLLPDFRGLGTDR